MKKEIERLKKTRIFLLDIIKDLTAEQLNNIPTGFNNNIIWNLGHLIASQQGLCYSRAGINYVVDEQFFNAYKAQTKPNGFVSKEDIQNIKELLISTLETLEQDYNKEIFSGYTSYTTRYDIRLDTIDDAINFLVFHEGLHMGYIMAMKKLI